SHLAAAARACGMSRPLLVTDGGLAQSALVGSMRGELDRAGLSCGLFADVRSNPTESDIAAGLDAFRAGAHDGVVAIGGGSALDAGKLIAFMIAQQRPIWDFEDIGDHWRRARVEGIAPVVAVPTTAGTGSEVGRAGVVTDEKAHVKKVIFHPAMLPRTAILDPEATRGLPPGLTAATGMDALAHALEAYCAPAFHPMADGIAVEAVRLVLTSLERAFRDGDDLEARGDMLAAAAMGAVAFQKGLGAIHALSHPIGAVHDTHHGLTNAVVMPYVLAFNSAAVEERLDRLAAWLDLPGAGGGGRGCDALLDRILALRESLGIPHTLAELGLVDPDYGHLAAIAVRDPTAAGNPVPLDEEICRTLYDRAHRGVLPLR
ncbi:MAG: iron-containing alcohol dehydrogenase, partial [Geminicoccaceae bacterium]|nr:iron-containing alcohol dehydrogenase [Geminicoccaceae bacterium]